MNTTHTSEPPIEREALQRVLESEVEESAQRIGEPGAYFRIGSYSDEEMAAYANGVKSVIQRLLEHYELENSSLGCKQIDAAIGERLRRVGSKRQKLSTRRLNNIVEAIRDKRIAMLDRYEGLDYKLEYAPLQKKLWAIERHGVRDEQEGVDYQVVDRELKALFDLSSQLINDKSWMARHFELREKAQVAA
jgi:hypothetical protein